MIREWASEDTLYEIDERLLPPASMLAATWDDDEAWESFAAAMSSDT